MNIPMSAHSKIRSAIVVSDLASGEFADFIRMLCEFFPGETGWRLASVALGTSATEANLDAILRDVRKADAVVAVIADWTVRRKIRENARAAGVAYLNPYAAALAPFEHEFDECGRGFRPEQPVPTIRQMATWLLHALSGRPTPPPRFLRTGTTPAALETALALPPISPDTTVATTVPSLSTLLRLWILDEAMRFADLPVALWRESRVAASPGLLEQALEQLATAGLFGREQAFAFFARNHLFATHYPRYYSDRPDESLEEAEWLRPLYLWMFEHHGWDWVHAHGCFFTTLRCGGDALSLFRQLREQHASSTLPPVEELLVWQLIGGQGVGPPPYPALQLSTTDDLQRVAAFAAVAALMDRPDDAVRFLAGRRPAFQAALAQRNNTAGTLLLVRTLQVFSAAPELASYAADFAATDPTTCRVMTTGINLSLRLRPLSPAVMQSLSHWYATPVPTAS
jgi:hypothetical protein